MGGPIKNPYLISIHCGGEMAEKHGNKNREGKGIESNYYLHGPISREQNLNSTDPYAWLFHMNKVTKAQWILNGKTVCLNMT